MRWRMEDGSSGQISPAGDHWRSTLGWTRRPDGHRITLGRCESGEITFDGLRGTRIPLVVTETRFTAAGTTLIYVVQGAAVLGYVAVKAIGDRRIVQAEAV